MADYTTLALLKASLGITDSSEDTALSAAITAASRRIDRLTRTAFGVGAGTSARVFEPVSTSEVWVDPFTDATGLVVKTGTDGTYPTTLTATYVILHPLNASARSEAYYRLILGSGSFPCSYGFPTVQVTARWGYDTIPADVGQACLIEAARVFRRKDSPEGVAGTSDFGVVRVSKYEDPDFLKLLRPYMSVGA